MPNGVMDTADGQINVTMIRPTDWQPFCQAIEQPWLLDDPRFATYAARAANLDELYTLIRPVFAAHTTAWLSERLTASGIMNGRVNSYQEFLQEEQVAATGIMAWLEQPGVAELVPMPNIPGLPPLQSGTKRAHAPKLGEHTREVLAEHGYSAGEIAVLFDKKVVAGALSGRGRPDVLKIATFNINNVNRRLPNLLAWLRDSRPDVVCLQELKAADSAFPASAIRDAGYGAVWRGQQTWNGVAILARNAEPVLTRRHLPGDAQDGQSRYIEAAVQGVLIGCIYLPNGNPRPGPKFAYKLAWFDRLIAHAAELLATGLPVVLAGDYNVVPTDADIYPTKSWTQDALLQPQSRAAFRTLLDQGWTDAIRARYPTEPVYTFWDYKRDRWARNAGLRIDHILLAPALAAQLVDAGVDRDVRGEEGASDHAPAWAILDSRGRRKPRQAMK